MANKAYQSTKSNINSFKESNKNTQIASNSEVASTSSIKNQSLQQGDVDVYGNIIEYDPESWVGEDYVVDNEIKSKNIYSSEDVTKELGTLEISVSNDLRRENSNILVSLVDKKLNITNVYIYYKNNYQEKITLPVGIYEINNIIYLEDANVKLTSSDNRIEIKEDESFSLLLSTNIENKDEIISTKSIMNVDKNVKPLQKSIPVYIYIIIICAIVIFGIVIFKFISYIRNREDR